MNKPNTALLHQLKNLPKEPGVYRMLDTEGTVLYVGKAAHLKKRVNSYFNKQGLSPKTQALVSQIASIDVTITKTETEALLLESNLIKALRPKYNVLLRDDKSYPYIHIHSKHPFPRIELSRSKKKPSSPDYFGPYPGVNAVKDTLQRIQKVFKIRNCSDSYFSARTRPCLQYDIKRCSAPCVGYISEKEYQQSILDTTHFLQGKSQLLISELEKRMEEAVLKLAFEEAAFLRDQIKALRQVQEPQSMVQLRGDADVIAIEVQPGFACIQIVGVRGGQVLTSQSFFPLVPLKNEVWESIDLLELASQTFEAFIGFYYFDNPERIPSLIVTNLTSLNKEPLEKALTELSQKRCRFQIAPKGLKARWLEFATQNLQASIAEKMTATGTIKARFATLEALLELPHPIRRMECFDISHTMGSETIASCVVFDASGPANSLYRRFAIEGITAGDDYAAMEQAIKRRFKRLIAAQSLPDLLIIDGGKGQIEVARKVLDELAIKDVKILGIAKGPARKAGLERLFLVHEDKEIILPPDSKARLLLQHIRDEAHRFAITAHRKKRNKATLSSSLESIEGVGLKRRKALLYRFGGLRELKLASINEIAKVPGISQTLAAKIYQHFRDIH